MGRTTYVFFLGGHDLEMLTIRALLTAHGASYHDADLPWGARASAYRAEIDAALQQGQTPVLVELEPDITLPPGRTVIVDHHGLRAGAARPSSLRQVFDLLHLPASAWTREFDLVTANDVGHVAGMRGLVPPASDDEIVRIRAADRAAQGVTPADEQAAARAVDRRRLLAGGALAVVTLPHEKTSAAADRFAPLPGCPACPNVLVRTPTSAVLFGDGPVVTALHARLGGWYGGALPARGYWGHAHPPADLEEIVAGVVTSLDDSCGAPRE